MIFSTTGGLSALISRLLILLIVLLQAATPVCADYMEQLNPRASEAALLLKIQPQVDRLFSLKRGRGSFEISNEELHLQMELTRKLLVASLEVRKSADILDKEIAYEYDVRTKMLEDRDHSIALNNQLNFTQFGVVGGIIGGGYYGLGRQPSAPLVSNILQLISGATTFFMSSVALLQTRGGSRALPSNTNMLAQFLGLPATDDCKFPPLIWDYLNSVAPDSKDGLTRRQEAIAHWKRSKVLTLNLDKQKQLEKVAACGSSHKENSESIKLITNRIVMLHTVHSTVELLDSDLVELLQAID